MKNRFFVQKVPLNKGGVIVQKTEPRGSIKFVYIILFEPICNIIYINYHYTCARIYKECYQH